MRDDEYEGLDDATASLARRMADTLASRKSTTEVIATLAEAEGQMRSSQARRPSLTPDQLAQQRLQRLLRYKVPYQVALMAIDHRRSRTFEETAAISAVTEFLSRAQEGFENLCVLAGAVGVGKTVATAHFLEQANPQMRFGIQWRTSQEPLFMHASELMVMGLYGHEEEREKLASVKALVIDDVGVERLDAGGVGVALYDWLVNARYGAAGYTVITTNLPWDTFKERYGERVADRLREQAYWHDIEGTSMRRGTGC